MRLLRARSATQILLLSLPVTCNHRPITLTINKAGRHTAAATRQSRRREVAELKMHSSMTVTLSMILKHNYNGNRVGNLSVPVRSDRETIRQ